MKKQSHEMEKDSDPDASPISIDEQTKKGLINVYQYSRLNQAQRIK